MLTFRTFYLAAAAALAVSVAPLTAGAVTVNDTIDFNDGTLTGSNIKTYTEDDYQFYDARIVGGPCEVSGADKCAALNKHEKTVLTRKDGGAFDLTSLWFYLNGKAEDLTNALAVFDTNNQSHRFDLTQAVYEHNVGHTVALDFFGVTSITFSSGGTLNCTDKKGKVEPCKDQGNARFDTAKLSHPAPVPLPASGLLLVGAIAGVASLRKRRSL